MANPVRIVGHDSDRANLEGYTAQVDKNGNLHVIIGTIEGLNKSYEDTSFIAGDSPVIIDFYGDTGRYAQGGWIVCDGDGDIQVDFTSNGVIYGDKFTVKLGETVDFGKMDISKLRITHTGTDSSYRVCLI